MRNRKERARRPQVEMVESRIAPGVAGTGGAAFGCGGTEVRDFFLIILPANASAGQHPAVVTTQAPCPPFLDVVP
jgi:hypothetical protein